MKYGNLETIIQRCRKNHFNILKFYRALLGIMGEIANANTKARIPVNTAIIAPTPKGLAPSFEMVLNFTFEPTPAKHKANKNLKIESLRVALTDNQLNPYAAI